MSSSQPAGCSKPASAAAQAEQPDMENETSETKEQGAGAMIKAGQKAPEFSAGAYQNGGLSTVNLSDYLGQWVVLCFYPGDFTFV